MARVRDRFWLWGHDAGSHDTEWNLPGPSRITPVEAACYLRIPNVIMVRYSAASSPATERSIVPFKALSRVVWSIVGAGGVNLESETREVLGKLPQLLPNMTGVIMDDFFKIPAQGDHSEGSSSTPAAAVFTLAELEAWRQHLSDGGRRLDLWVVLYAHQLTRSVVSHLSLCDKVTFWTWRASELPRLEERFSELERFAPEVGKLLGCYMWDYGDKKPIQLETMKRQCELALEWLMKGRIEGVIFLASCISDLGIETVEWTRDWISQIGDIEIPGQS